jgi:hypothetical protein
VVTLASKVVTLVNKEVTLASKEVTLVNKEATLVSKVDTLVNKEVILASKVDTLVNKEVILASKEVILVNKEVILVNKEVTLVSKVASIFLQDLSNLPLKMVFQSSLAIQETSEMLKESNLESSIKVDTRTRTILHQGQVTTKADPRVHLFLVTQAKTSQLDTQVLTKTKKSLALSKYCQNTSLRRTKMRS